MPDGLRVKSTRTGQTVTPPRQPAQGLYPQDGGASPVAWPMQRTWDMADVITLSSGEEIDVLIRPDNRVMRGDEEIGAIDQWGRFMPRRESSWENIERSFGETFDWWEKPKEWAERGMEAVGEGMANVPIVPEALSFVAPAFQWIHEELEKPWSAFITAPFSPDLPWEEGESWIEHEKREYEAWDAPTYVKGAAEFTMPLWWVPWLGWAGKGAKSLSAANRLVKAGKLIPKVPEHFVLPSYEIIESQISKDIYRVLAHWSENMPVINKMVRAVGGPAAFIKRNPQTLADKAKNYAVFRGVQLDMGNNVVSVKMRQLQKTAMSVADEARLLKLDGTKVGVVKVTKSKPGVIVGNKVSMELDDVITHPELYEWIEKPAYDYVTTAHEVAEYFERMAYANGVKLPKRFTFRGKDFQYLPRIVEGVERGKGFEAIKGAMNPFERIVYDTALEGVETGVKYGAGVASRVELLGRAIVKRTTNQQFDNSVKHFGQTALARLEEYAPEVVKQFSAHTNRIGVLQKALQGLKLTKPLKGGIRPMHGSLFNTVTAEFPGLAAKMADVSTMKRLSVVDGVQKMSITAQKIIGMDTDAVVNALKKLPETASLDNITEVVTKFSTREQRAIRFVERIYKQDAMADVADYTRRVNEIIEESTKLLQAEKIALAPVKKELAVAKAKFGKPVTGWFEETIKRHPAFAGRVFPKEVVDILQPLLQDRGNQWLKSMSQISGASRVLVAALDLSAPFIQGTMAFGLNPIAWGKATGQMVRVMAQPRYLYRELAKREASIMDRIAHGGSTSMIDIFESMPLIRKTAGAVAGKPGQWVVGQTYGRAEAAFLGFSEIARDELWKVGRLAITKKGLAEAAQEKQLNELARTLDRMTGVMSTQALGIGLAQRQFESAWMFFAPRYTRAYFSFFGDLIKGGMSGAEARKAMAGFMLGGVTMYTGACNALEQQPNFNPRSPQFMTIKVGDRYVGVGGVAYGVMRLMADTIAVTADDITKLSPTNLSRVDNPFYKFLFSRTAPLTSLTVGLAIEQKDYLGRPLESLEDYVAFLADKVVPIAAQPFIPLGKEEWQEEQITPTTVGAEFAGLRTFPQGEWDKLKKMRTKYALSDYGKPYEELNIEQKDQMQENHEEYKKLDEEAREHITLERGEDFDILTWNARKQADAKYFGKAEPLALALEAGRIPYRDFNRQEELYSMIYQGERSMASIMRDMSDTDTYQDWKKWMEKQPEEDKALYEYWRISRRIKTLPETGMPDWETREREVKGYLDTLDRETRDYIEKNKSRHLSNYPPTLRKLKEIQIEGRDVVSEYYDQPEGRERTLFRRTNPTVDAWLLIMGRVTRPQSELAARMAMEMLQQRGLPQTLLTGGVTPSTGAPAGTPMGTGRPRTMRVKSLR